MPKKVLIALPPAMLQEVDHIALQEHRSRSDLIRESLRRYINAWKQSELTLGDKLVARTLNNNFSPDTA